MVPNKVHGEYINLLLHTLFKEDTDFKNMEKEISKIDLKLLKIIADKNIVTYRFFSEFS